jgi:hypothetical protein
MLLPDKTDGSGKQNMQFPFIFELNRPRRAQVELQFQGQPAVQACDGNSGSKLRPVLGRQEKEPYASEEIAGTAQELPTTRESSEMVQTAPSPQQLVALTQESLPLSPPLSPEQVEPKTLHVSYDDNQLTIVADNSTLSEILAEVRAQTKADIDIPTGASGERMAAVRLGPGPAREVLTSLLSWTNFDYIIQASDTNSQGIQSVLLVARSKATAGAAAGTALASTRQPLGGAPRRVVEPNPTPAETPGAENQPATSAEVPPSQHQVVTSAPESNSSQPQLKTTQDMIQELQRMYKQRRQQIQQGQGQKPRTGA